MTTPYKKRDWSWQGWQVRYAFYPCQQEQATQASILFIHGFGASIDHWRKNLGYFSADRVSYAIDLVGFGASEKIERSFQVEFWVEQLFAFWRKFLGEPIILVGNSIGSLVAMVETLLVVSIKNSMIFGNTILLEILGLGSVDQIHTTNGLEVGEPFMEQRGWPMLTMYLVQGKPQLVGLIVMEICGYLEEMDLTQQIRVGI